MVISCIDHTAFLTWQVTNWIYYDQLVRSDGSRRSSHCVIFYHGQILEVIGSSGRPDYNIGRNIPVPAENPERGGSGVVSILVKPHNDRLFVGSAQRVCAKITEILFVPRSYFAPRKQFTFPGEIVKGHFHSPKQIYPSCSRKFWLCIDLGRSTFCVRSPFS